MNMSKKEFAQLLYKVMIFTIPMSAGGIINVLASFISMMMVASLGKSELAAGALAITTNIAVMTIVTTIFFAIGILISFARGQGKSDREVGVIFKNGCWIAVFFTIPAAAVLWHIDKLLLLIGEDPNLVVITRGFFHFAALSLLPTFINAVIAQVYAGIGKTRFTLYFALVNLPLMVAASYVFVLGHFGMPRLGLGGIMCAALIIQFTLAVSVLTMMQLRGVSEKYQLFSGKKLPDLAICKSILTLGAPIGLQFGGEIAAMTTGLYMMGHFGETALAAAQVVSQYALFVVMIIIGMTQALGILVSEAFGRKDVSLINQYVTAANTLFLIVFAGVSIVFLCFPTQLTVFYLGSAAINPELEFLTNAFFILSALFFFFDGFRNLYAGALRGLHDSRAPMRIGIISLWIISIPISYIIGFTLNGGPIGLRAGFLTGIILCAFLLWRRFRKHRKLFI